MMKTTTMLQVAECAPSGLGTVAPNTGREAPASMERKWESFPQPCGWSVQWDNEGLLFADAQDVESSDEKS